MEFVNYFYIFLSYFHSTAFVFRKMYILLPKALRNAIIAMVAENVERNLRSRQQFVGCAALCPNADLGACALQICLAHSVVANGTRSHKETARIIFLYPAVEYVLIFKAIG